MQLIIRRTQENERGWTEEVVTGEIDIDERDIAGIRRNTMLIFYSPSTERYFFAYLSRNLCPLGVDANISFTHCYPNFTSTMRAFYTYTEFMQQKNQIKLKTIALNRGCENHWKILR